MEVDIVSSFIYLPKYELLRTYSVQTKFSDSKYNQLAKLSPLQTKFFAAYGSDPQITDYSDASGSKDKDYSFHPYVSIDTKYGENFQNLFSGHKNVYIIDWLNLTSLTNGRNLFYNCSGLFSLKIECASLKTSTIQSAFFGCSNLQELQILGTIKVDSNDLSFTSCPLTVNSILNILHALEDNTEEATLWTVYLGQTNLSKLTEAQKAIATNKNIALA